MDCALKQKAKTLCWKDGAAHPGGAVFRAETVFDDFVQKGR